tara:strand:+ start:90 stop:404 length:315 start_codon:yes stop_codon:yes gene_type:complete
MAKITFEGNYEFTGEQLISTTPPHSTRFIFGTRTRHLVGFQKTPHYLTYKPLAVGKPPTQYISSLYPINSKTWTKTGIIAYRFDYQSINYNLTIQDNYATICRF